MGFPIPSTRNRRPLIFLRLLYESFRRQRRRKLLAGLAILLGTTAVTAMLALATTIGDRIHAELAVYGANIIVTPQAANLDVKIGNTDIHPTTGNAYLHESDLAKLKTIFWANNITAISPELPLELHTALDGRAATISALGLWFPPHSVSKNSAVILSGAKDPDASSTSGADGSFQPRIPSSHSTQSLFNSGAPQLHPLWNLRGDWPKSPNEIIVGANLAKEWQFEVGHVFSIAEPAQEMEDAHRPIPLALPLTITGIVTTGEATDNQLLLPLATAQRLNNTPDAISRIEISARTKPEDAFARRDPATLSPADHDRWYCSPYANSIAYQIQEAIPGSHAEQVRKIEQSEGNILSRISGLLWLISAAALLAAGFAVSAAMATAILERRAEIGLMRSLGAAKSSIALLFYAEIAVLALIAGTIGYLFGSLLAGWLGNRIFADGVPAASQLSAIAASFNPVLLPVTVGLALIVAIAGSTPSIRTALRLDPSTTLRADA